MVKRLIINDKLTTYIQQLEALGTPEAKAQIEWVIKSMEQLVEQFAKMKHNPGLMVKAIYAAMDKVWAADNSENAKMVSCRKGCSFCCHINVDLFNEEIIPIMDYVKKNNIQIDLDYLRRQVAAGKNIHKSGASACVFLKNHECSIYPVRPMACRKFKVVSPPSLCNTETTEQVLIYFNQKEELMDSALANVATGSTPLPALVLLYLTKLI